MYLPSQAKDLKVPAVLEFGNFTTRAGFAGEDVPGIMANSCLGLVDDPSTSSKKLFEFNPHVLPSVEDFSVVQPLKNNMSLDMDLAEYYLEYFVQEKLGASFEKTPLFLVEPAIHNKDLRLNMVQLMFEKFKAPSVFFHKAPLLALYVFSGENATILDIGAKTSYCTPVVDGFISSKGVMKADFGGENLTNELSLVFDMKGETIPSFASMKYQEQLQGKNVSKSIDEYLRICKLDIIREIKHQTCKLVETSIDKLKFREGVDNGTFELPDKKLLVLSKEMYSVPETLFRPSLTHPEFKGLQMLVKECLEKTDIDARRDLLSNIIITGGCSLMPNLIERLQKELMDMNIMGMGHRVKTFTTVSTAERRYANWLGGSILASMSTFGNLAMSAQEYEEHGAILIERKCLS